MLFLISLLVIMNEARGFSHAAMSNLESTNIKIMEPEILEDYPTEDRLMRHPVLGRSLMMGSQPPE